MIPYLLLEDANCGIRKPAKVSGVPLPPQYDLLRLLQDVENLLPSWNSTTPACEWEQVSCKPSGQIAAIYWCDKKFRGSLIWNYLPSKLERLNVARNQLSGDVPFDVLPATLKGINLSNNRFSGTPSFRYLPALNGVGLRANNFEGWVNFEFLALSVRHLFVNDNLMLQGSLNVAERAKMNYDINNTNISSSNGELSAFPDTLTIVH